MFDLDNSGDLDINEIRTAFTKFGKDLSDKEMKEILSAHDVDNDGSITKEEFRKIFFH